MVAAVEHERSRRKALLYVSNGYAFAPPRYGAPATDPRSVRGQAMTLEEVRHRFSALTRQARRAGVRVFALDPRRLPVTGPPVDRPEWDRYVATMRETLRAISDQTRGLALLDIQDPVEAANRISSTLR
jgi:hypothetical protein